MGTNREAVLQMLDVLREYIEKTGQDKYTQLDLPEPHDIIIGAGMGVEYFWGEMYKRMHEIAVKCIHKEDFALDLLKVLHEGLCLLSYRHPELIRQSKPKVLWAPPGKEAAAQELMDEAFNEVTEALKQEQRKGQDETLKPIDWPGASNLEF